MFGDHFKSEFVAQGISRFQDRGMFHGRNKNLLTAVFIRETDAF